MDVDVLSMRVLPFAEVRENLEELVDAVFQTMDRILIVKDDAPVAVLMGIDEWDTMQDTLQWLSTPGSAESVAESEADVAAGRSYGEDEIRDVYGAGPATPQ